MHRLIFHYLQASSDCFTPVNRRVIYEYSLAEFHTVSKITDKRRKDPLFVSQPTFSYQIKLLEEEVGFEIFERNGKGATLTPAGQQFVSFLVSMREDMKRAIEQGQHKHQPYGKTGDILPARSHPYI